MKYELIESPTDPGTWHVEAFTEEGECIKAVFSGPKAREFAATWRDLCATAMNIATEIKRIPDGISTVDYLLGNGKV